MTFNMIHLYITALKLQEIWTQFDRLAVTFTAHQKTGKQRQLYCQPYLNLTVCMVASEGHFRLSFAQSDRTL